MSPRMVESVHGWPARVNRADPAILNKTLTVNGALMTVIGVARAGFQGVQVGQTPDVFIPMMTRWNAETRQRFLDKRIVLDDGAKGRQILQLDAKKPILILMGMAGLALLITCANVANLLLARGAARQREIAVRMALGAGRFRLMRQFLVESLLLSLMGGMVGLIVAVWTIQGLVASIPPSIGALGLSAELNPRLLGFALALSALTGLLFGVAPAARAARLNLEATLREQGSGVSGGLSGVRFRKALVVSQIVLTTALLVGAGLFARSLNNLARLDLGLRAD